MTVNKDQAVKANTLPRRMVAKVYDIPNLHHVTILNKNQYKWFRLDLKPLALEEQFLPQFSSVFTACVDILSYCLPCGVICELEILFPSAPDHCHWTYHF